MYDEPKFLRFCKWCKEKINNCEEKYGESRCKKVASVLVLIVGIIFSLFIALGKIKTNEKTDAWLISHVIGEEKEVSVVRMGKINEGITVKSLISDLITSGLISDSEKEVVSMFGELANACESMSEHTELLLIPKEAGGIEFDSIGVYGWKKSWNNLLGKEFIELHMAMFMLDSYINVVIEWTNKSNFLFGFEVSIENGRCKVL